MCQRAAGRSRRVCERLLRIVQSALLAFYLADLDDLWRYQHVLGELRTEWCVAPRADGVASNASPLRVKIARRACSGARTNGRPCGGARPPFDPSAARDWRNPSQWVWDR